MLDLPGFSRRIELNRAHNFLETGVTDHLAGTMFADASNIGPGRYLRLDLNSWSAGDPLPVQTYWRPPLPDDRQWSEDEAAERFRELFLDSVRLHMRADVRVGSCLSGGLDSSSIVCALAKVCRPDSEKFNAISAVFPGASIDESYFIDQAVEKAGVASTRITLAPDTVFSDAEAIVRAQDEPYGSTSIHAQYHVFRKAREIGVKVMLDGQGADEIMGGYHGCFHYHYASLIRHVRLGDLLQTLSERKAWHGLGYRQQLAPFAARLPGPMRNLLHPAGSPAPPDAAWMNSAQLAPFRPSQGSVLRQALEAEGLGPSRSLGDYCVVLTRSTSLPMLLRYEDRNSMAHGIEARVPFLDHRLVEFVLRLGDQHKIVGGDTKRVLRRAMENILPEPIRLRRDKLGFATPEEMWFKGPLRKAVEAGVEETLALYPDLLVRDATREFARQVLDGQRPFDFSLWRIVVFGIWGRTFGMSL
jgi:asparagine synthase (glutamine-hydrolysing)